MLVLIDKSHWIRLYREAYQVFLDFLMHHADLAHLTNLALGRVATRKLFIIDWQQKQAKLTRI